MDRNPPSNFRCVNFVFVQPDGQTEPIDDGNTIFDICNSLGWSGPWDEDPIDDRGNWLVAPDPDFLRRAERDGEAIVTGLVAIPIFSRTILPAEHRKCRIRMTR